MKNRLKKHIKKIVLCVASCVMVLSGLTLKSYALTGTTSSEVPSSWYLTNPVTGERGGHEGYLKVNGEPVFCVDYHTTFHSGKTVTAGTPADIGLSEDNAKRLSLIAYFGTKVLGRTSQDWYAITQGLLWREIHNDTSLNFVSCSTAPTYADQQRCWSQILADVDRYYVMPSFTSGTQEVDMDGKVRLTDTNGVLSDMVVVSSGNLNVSISGNDLIINGSLKADDLTNIVLKKNIAASETGTTIVYTASDCQALGSFKIADPVRVAFRVKTNKFGSFELTKYNEDKTGTVPNTTYRITGPNGYDQTVTTDEYGKVKLDRLPIGDYQCVEEKAGTGYLINTTEFSFTVKANETTTVDPSNVEPTGKIQFMKSIDISQTSHLQGDAFIKDNSYTLYADENITNVAGTKKFYEKDEKVSTKKTDDKGIIIWDDLPLGKYYIQETESNETLLLNKDTIRVSIDYQGQTVSKVVVDKETSDRVNMQKIQVFKSGEGEGISGVVKGLQGAEFTFKLKSEVDHVGWDNATVYDIITTDENGKANTKYLPYGTYLVKETNTPANYITAPDFTVSVTDDYSEYKDVEQVKKINVNNAPFQSQVKLIKVDKATGKKITLNSASFKIKDSKGNYVVQKVGGVKYDTFTTNSKNNNVVAKGKNGEVTLPLKLGAGTYTIEEVETPKGFLITQPIEFTITNVHDYDMDDDKDPIITITITNEQPKGKLVINKTDKETSLALESVEYELRAAKNVFSAIDGSLIFVKDALVAFGKTDVNGQIIIDNLYMGEYKLKETLTVEDYVLSENVHDVIFEQKDLTTKEYTSTVKVTNVSPSGEIHIVKTDKDTKELLSGVTFELTADENIYSLDGRNTLIYKKGETVSKDISENGLYITNELGEIHIGDLPLGKYQLKEVKTLEGYYSNDKVYDIDLSYNHSDKTVYVKNLDITNEKTITEVSKLEATESKELSGAKLSLKDEKGNIINEWTSQNEPHIIRGLLVNQKYTLHEDLAPVGYATTSDVIFTVQDDGKPTKVSIVDEITKVSISKQDVTTGKELAGASLIIKDKDGNVVDEWISTDHVHIIEGLHVGEQYTLTEVIAPEGYLKAESITFTVQDTGEIQKVVMKDERKVVVIKTGDDTDLYSMILIAVGSSALLIALLYRYKRKKDEK